MLNVVRVATTYVAFFIISLEHPIPSFGFLVPSIVVTSPSKGIEDTKQQRHHFRCGVSPFSGPIVINTIMGTTTTTTTHLMARSPSKWDNIVDEDDIDKDSSSSSSLIGSASIPVPPDMTYEPRNVKRQHENFLAIRSAGGKEVTNDVYVRNPTEDVFWYGGKVARVSDVSLEDCIGRQWHMIERHATNLRPLDLYPHRGHLEIWTAPGDSELEVAYNRPTLQLKKMTPRVVTSREVKNNRVGFQGEIYQDGEEGFRTWRTNDGYPARPEINEGGETRPPTDEEYARIQKQLQGKDIQAIYEEQERRTQQGLL